MQFGVLVSMYEIRKGIMCMFALYKGKTLDGLGKLKENSDLVGNRTRENHLK
jgi:hypothetical protein